MFSKWLCRWRAFRERRGLEREFRRELGRMLAIRRELGHLEAGKRDDSAATEAGLEKARQVLVAFTRTMFVDLRRVAWVCQLLGLEDEAERLEWQLLTLAARASRVPLSWEQGLPLHEGNHSRPEFPGWLS
jgi:hypothetical protein